MVLWKVLGQISVGARQDKPTKREDAEEANQDGTNVEEANQDGTIQVSPDNRQAFKQSVSNIIVLHHLTKHGPQLAAASSLGVDLLCEEMNGYVAGIDSSLYKAFPSLFHEEELLDECQKLAMEMMAKSLAKADANRAQEVESKANKENYSLSDEDSEATIQSLSPSSLSEELNSYDESEGDSASHRVFRKDIYDDTVGSISVDREHAVQSSLSPLASPPPGSIACSDCEQEAEAEFDVVPEHQSDTASVRMNDEDGENAAPFDVNPGAISVHTNDAVLEVVQQLNDDAAELSNLINQAIERNNSFLNKLDRSAMEGSRYIYGLFDPYTPMIAFILHKLNNGGDLKSVIACLRDYATVLVTDMSIFKEVKADMKRRAANMRQRAAHMERDANGISFDIINGTAAGFARYFSAEAVKGDTDEANNGDSVVEELSEAYSAAIVAYNKYHGKEYERLPKCITVVHQEVKNASSVLMCVLIAFRVSNRIKLSNVSKNSRDQGFLELIHIIARVVKPSLTRDNLFGMTLYQAWKEILYPTIALSLDQLFEQTPTVSGEMQPLLSIIIQTTTLFKDEMGDQKHIEKYKRSECVSTVEDMDNLSLDEIERRKEQMKDEDYYFCEKRKGKLKKYRRKPCGAILSSLINGTLLAKTLAPFGLQDSTIDTFVFGLLCSAPYRFVSEDRSKTVPLAFLFEEENFRRRTGENDDVVEAFVANHIKPVMDTARDAMKAFEDGKHFAANCQLPHFTTYLARTANVQNDS